ncbi:protein tyrosine phosphatase domain-containing protein 1 isoform X2 [Silurus meridionalis]|uniref:protein tyrosine phosphatase domain-containing protein 1 isoform X2 n=1 Tax=Silurus meridionalis TaxID=175797 RepID=UPI001EEB7A8F|nr:protein tyrosine phosphatase domain-containing protein 1 isoform X2 [Silurus meridionalis]
MRPKTVPKPSYSQAREALVKAIPPKVICLLACGGRDCRYEGPVCWRPSQQAIKGLFSSWMTDDIIAMARPSTNLIKTYNIIDQLKRLNIKSIINMQLPGEHAHCGPELDPDSGFTYSPQIFMENQIYFYNFGMADFGVSCLEGILDAVKVLAFSVQEGKVAVHCHAGLGRTGVLIASYLIYTLRISASEAVHYVRIKRPCSIQTRAQISLVFDFERLMGSQLVQYPMLNMHHGAPFSMRQYLQRQATLLHGEEARSLSHTPKILHFLCSLLTALAQGAPIPSVVQQELEKKAGNLVLQQTVRNVLVLQRYLPVLVDREDSCESVSSWDEPFGFLERKREMLLNKRSYSESDLSKISLNKDMKFIHNSILFGNGGKINNGFLSQLKKDILTNPASNVLINESKCETDRMIHITSSNHLSNPNAGKRAKCMVKTSQGFPKFSSNIELRKNNKYGKVSLASRTVAKAMAQKEPTDSKVLQRIALLQEELNISAYGWATLAMETDAKVLSALMWIWLEKLKDPVLSADDISKLTNPPCPNPLKTLHKSQSSTLCCLLNCVAQVTFRCPHLEKPVLQELIKALTRNLTEETDSYNTLLKVFGSKVREIQYFSHFNKTAGMSTVEKIS